jgi:integrase
LCDRPAGGDHGSRVASCDGCKSVDNPAVRLAVRAIRRAQGRALRQAAGLTTAVLARIEAQIGATLLDTRDVAILRVARDLARREELSRLAVADVTLADDGTATVIVRRSKTDHAGEGHGGFLGADVSSALRAWLRRAQIGDGPLFHAMHRSGLVRTTPLPPADVARVIRRRAAAALGADAGARYSGHSACVGIAQDVLAANASLASIVEAGWWTLPSMVGRYTRALSERGTPSRSFPSVSSGRDQIFDRQSANPLLMSSILTGASQ